MATTVVISVIIGFTIYFNNHGLNQAWSVQQQQQKDRMLSHVTDFCYCCYHSVGTGEPGDSGGTPVTFTLVRCLIESSAQEILAPILFSPS
jgi:hypothetical protein